MYTCSRDIHHTITRDTAHTTQNLGEWLSYTIVVIIPCPLYDDRIPLHLAILLPLPLFLVRPPRARPFSLKNIAVDSIPRPHPKLRLKIQYRLPNTIVTFGGPFIIAAGTKG